MLRGRDFENALNKALDYGGKAATAYQVGIAAYAAGRFHPAPHSVKGEILHGLRERTHNVHRAMQKVANAAAAAGIAAGVAGGAVAARGLYEKARPALMHSRPDWCEASTPPCRPTTRYGPP